MTLNGEMALILHYFNEFDSFRGEFSKSLTKLLTIYDYYV